MLLGTLEQGLIFGIMTLGLYISYKILDFPDLTVDGSFPLGSSIVAILLVHGMNPILALMIAFVGGALAGFITGFIHIKFKITDLLAGIIVMTGLYSVNLRIMGRSNIPLFATKHMFTNQSTVFILIGIVVFCKLLIDFLLKTKLGFSLRALGDNETLVVSLGIDEKKLKIIGLMIANGFVAVSGGILAQYQGFSDISMGTGTIITGLASIIIGESIFKNIRLVKVTTFVIVGAIIYRFIIAGSLEIGFNPSDIKLITAILTVGIMAYKSKKKKVKIKSKGGEVKNA